MIIFYGHVAYSYKIILVPNQMKISALRAICLTFFISGGKSCSQGSTLEGKAGVML